MTSYNCKTNFIAVAQDRENIQTLQFCEKLGIKSPWSAVDETPVKNPAEISLDSSDDETGLKLK